MRLIKVVLVSLALTSPAALAQEPAPPPSAPPVEASEPATPDPAQQANQDSAPELVCRTIVRTESRLRSRRERVCTPAPRSDAPAEAAESADQGASASDGGAAPDGSSR